VLVAIVRKQLALEPSLYTLLPILSVTLFEKLPILSALAKPQTRFDEPPEPPASNQLKLFII